MLPTSKWQKQLGKMRVSGLIPLLAFAALIAFTAGHAYGWMVMPSAAQELNGPLADSATVAALSAGVDGDLRVGEGASLLYEVGPVRRGGDIGIPEAVEQVRESAIMKSLMDRDTDLANDVWDSDDEVDALYDGVCRQIFLDMGQNPKTIEASTHFLWVAHDLERIADRATNIAERVIFVVTGRIGRYKQPSQGTD